MAQSKAKILDLQMQISRESLFIDKGKI